METANECYENGVKVLMVMDRSNPLAETTTVTMKKGSTVCYTGVIGPYSADAGAGTTSYTLKNGAGTAVASVVWDYNARIATITCTGDSPVVVSLDCPRRDGGTSDDTGASCTPGICTP